MFKQEWRTDFERKQMMKMSKSGAEAVRVLFFSNEDVHNQIIFLLVVRLFQETEFGKRKRRCKAQSIVVFDRWLLR